MPAVVGATKVVVAAEGVAGLMAAGPVMDQACVRTALAGTAVLVLEPVSL